MWVWLGGKVLCKRRVGGVGGGGGSGWGRKNRVSYANRYSEHSGMIFTVCVCTGRNSMWTVIVVWRQRWKV